MGEGQDGRLIKRTEKKPIYPSDEAFNKHLGINTRKNQAVKKSKIIVTEKSSTKKIVEPERKFRFDDTQIIVIVAVRFGSVRRTVS